MKKILLLIASAAIALAVNAAPQKVDFGKLPKNSQEFIQKNFPGEKVKAVEMDREASWDKYTVYFNSGNQVSFEGGSGDCSQIIMKNGSVPMSVIPAKVKTYAPPSGHSPRPCPRLAWLPGQPCAARCCLPGRFLRFFPPASVPFGYVGIPVWL